MAKNQYLRADQKFIRVIGELDESLTPDSYIEGKGYYLESGSVWIYNEGRPFRDPDRFPYFWYDTINDKYVYSKPDESVAAEFDVENTSNTTFERIVEETVEGEVLYDPEMVRDMNAAAEIYKPEIKEGDDFLTQLIKTIILEKGTDTNAYKSRVDSKYILNNLITALDGDTKMSMKYFAIWKELLGFDFTIDIWDNGKDSSSKLKSIIKYDSRTCKIIIDEVKGLTEKNENK